MVQTPLDTVKCGSCLSVRQTLFFLIPLDCNHPAPAVLPTPPLLGVLTRIATVNPGHAAAARTAPTGPCAGAVVPAAPPPLGLPHRALALRRSSWSRRHAACPMGLFHHGR